MGLVAGMNTMLPTNSNIHNDILRQNNYRYEQLLDCIVSLRTCSPEMTLRLVELIGEYAWSFHSGRFADGAIENRGLEVASEVEHCERRQWRSWSLPTLALTQNSQRHLLHIATSVWNNGGLTRTIFNWIKTDTGRRSQQVSGTSSTTFLQHSGLARTGDRDQWGTGHRLPSSSTPHDEGGLASTVDT